MSSHPQPIETEIKIRWTGSPDQAHAHIRAAGFPLLEARTLEADQLYDRDPPELRPANKLLRLRQTVAEDGTTHATVTYKGPATVTRYKSREEIEFDVSSADRYITVLERLGYRPGFRYEKYRTKYAIDQQPGIVTVDETPIGVFLELEGPAEWIDATALKLGFQAADYMTESYSSLYLKHREYYPELPEHMVFLQ